MGKFVFVGWVPHLGTPNEFAINKVRRGEVEDALSLSRVALLSVANDDGDDYSKRLEAERVLNSLKAGGLLKPVGADTYSRADVLAIKDRLESRGLWGDALALWCGASDRGSEWVTREEATTRAIESGIADPGSNQLKNNPKWAEPYRRLGKDRLVEYNWPSLRTAWPEKKAPKERVRRVA